MPKPKGTKTYTDQHRGAELAKIHLAKKDLQLADETYRDIIFVASGSKSISAADLDARGRHRVLERFAELGWKPKAAKKAKATRRLADSEQARKIRALWIQLHQDGKIKNPSEEALVAYVKRMTRVDRLEWLDVKQASTVIEAMKKWQER